MKHVDSDFHCVAYRFGAGNRRTAGKDLPGGVPLYGTTPKIEVIIKTAGRR